MILTPPHTFTCRRSAQAGASLISMMVGMVIALFAVIAGLSLYRNAVSNVYGSNGVVPSSVQDGQLASGLLSAQIALQGAGFGIVSAASGSHFLMLSNGALANNRLSGTVATITGTAATGNTLIWISNPNLSASSASYTCNALVSDSGTRALYLLQASNCSPLATQWSQISWTTSATLIAPAAMSSAITFSANNASGCWPYGAVPKAMSSYEAPSAAVSVGIGYSSSVSGSSNSYTLCLANLVS
jgi:Tfp pilus assembly protein PilW